MVSVTINMTVEDMEFIKSELHKAEQNTYVPSREGAEADTEAVKLANAQINHVLNLFGW